MTPQRALCSLVALAESQLVGGAEALLKLSDSITLRSRSVAAPVRNNRELIDNFSKLLGSFQDSVGVSDGRLLNRDDLDAIESAGGYGARLRRIQLYLQFASRIRGAILSVRRLALLNLDTADLSFDRFLKRDRELAKCLFLIYAAVPVAALKLSNANRLLETAVGTLHELMGVRVAALVPVRSF